MYRSLFLSQAQQSQTSQAKTPTTQSVQIDRPQPNASLVKQLMQPDSSMDGTDQLDGTSRSAGHRTQVNIHTGKILQVKQQVGKLHKETKYIYSRKNTPVNYTQINNYARVNLLIIHLLLVRVVWVAKPISGK